MEVKNGRNSFFDGGLFAFIGLNIVGVLITILTLGICYPWAVCLVYKWEIEHTVIDGKRLKFSGTALGLFGNWIKWWFFTFITFGIYGFWTFIKVKDWKAKNTSFVN